MASKPASEGAALVGQPLRAIHVKVRPDRVEVAVCVAEERYARTDEALVRRCLQAYPTLGRHACRNGVGPVFAAVMGSTSTPHLLEHLVVDAQTRAAKDTSRVFTGTTQWSVQDALVANVAFSYEDDLVALSALNQALSFLNQALIELRG